MTTVARGVVESLRDVGTRFVFGVPSGAWIDYMEVMREIEGIDFVLVGHEGAGGVMADVCGRISGAPGACFGTFGPGATNLTTGVGGALLDRSPLLAFSDEVPDHLLGRTSQMNIDHQSLFKPITKWTTRLQPDRCAETIFEAVGIATAEVPGPVHIGLPAGTASMEVKASSASAHKGGALSAPSADALERMIAQISDARKPLIAVGLTAARLGLGRQICSIAEKHRLPVVLTPMAKGQIPENHPCYAGVLFHALSDTVAVTHQEADLVIGLGYDPVEFSYEEWLPDVPLVHIDTKPADLVRESSSPIIDVVGDLAAPLAKIVDLDPLDTAWDLDAVVDRRTEMFQRLAPPPGVFGPRAALDILRHVLPEDGVLAADVGAHLHLIGQQWTTPPPGMLLMTNGWSSMGFGIPAAIAAKLCLPDRAVCAVVGDGGFLMNAGELDTAKRLGLNIVFVLLTDHCLSLIRIKQERKGHAVFGTPIRSDKRGLGDSFLGVPVFAATDPQEFRAAVTQGFASDGPVIVEAFIDGSEYDELVLRANR